MYILWYIVKCFVTFFLSMSELLTWVLWAVLTYNSIEYVITYVPLVDWFIFPVR